MASNLSLPRLGKLPRPSFRTVKRSVKRVVSLGLALYFIPIVFAVYFGIGLLDFVRNKRRTLSTFDRYFFGNGVFTWLLSPFNLIMDLLCLPYWNCGVYQLEELPKGHQDEIREMIDIAHRNDLVGKLEAKLEGKKRGMIFFKWYGKNVDTSVEIPEYRKKFKYLRTIGVSIFNTRQSTGKHFGPLRVTLRVLYNLNSIQSEKVYVQVGPVVNRWRDSKLFIFDDTLQHQSCNQSDEVRYCMFVDILRPSMMRPVMSGILATLRVVISRFNAIFYKHWSMIK